MNLNSEETMAAVDIRTLEAIEGDLPKKALELVIEWMKLYQNDLLRIWETQEFIQLPPLV